MKVIEIRKRIDNGKPLKAFVDIELENKIIVREFRIVQEINKHPQVMCPQTSWKDPIDGRIKYKTIVTFPQPLKVEIDMLILGAWLEKKEKLHELRLPT